LRSVLSREAAGVTDDSLAAGGELVDGGGFSGPLTPQAASESATVKSNAPRAGRTPQREATISRNIGLAS
jgi:hypothetical protein